MELRICKKHGEQPHRAYESKTCKSGFAYRCQKCTGEKSARRREREKLGIPAQIKGVVGENYMCQTHGLIPLDECNKYESSTCKDGFRYICPKCQKQWSSEKYARDPEASKAAVRQFKSDNPDKTKQYFETFLETHPDWYPERLEDMKKDRWERKLLVIAHYGGKCVRCGEVRPEFLCLDHVNDDGKEHRETAGKGSIFYRWLEDNGFPNDPVLQVLCHNCNQKKQIKAQATTGSNARYARYHQKIKHEVMSHYCGGEPVCTCCGELDLEVLSMDHINGGGNKHRKMIDMIGGGSKFCKWLRDNGFPSGYRVLCHNCNFSLGHYDRCPHDL